MNTDNEDFPFRRFRRKSGLSQSEISELTGLSQSTVSRLEKEERVSKADFNHALVILAYIYKKEKGD